jgi:hypothetical protein
LIRGTQTSALPTASDAHRKPFAKSRFVEGEYFFDGMVLNRNLPNPKSTIGRTALSRFIAFHRLSLGQPIVSAPGRLPGRLWIR